MNAVCEELTAKSSFINRAEKEQGPDIPVP